ncbi:MAG: MFS transporter [Deltaproteobacteria bacterium]|nr:MFS transporter [Deltaproteobacteria bacterium]
MASAAMLGAGESYLNAFAIFLQGTAMQIGVLGTVPQLCGALSQIGIVGVMERVRSCRLVLVVLSVLQSMFWLLIAAIPWACGVRSSAVTVLILAVSGYHIVNGLIAPVWNSLIGDLVPVNVRGSFFGKRGKLVSLMTFISMFAAGQTLELFKSWSSTALGFFIIFAASFAVRVWSAYFLSKHADPSYRFSPGDRFTFADFLRRMPYSNFARFVLFISLLNLAVWLAAPYFSVYMLRDLGLSYTAFTFLGVTQILAQILTLQNWGFLVDRFGSKRILSFCAKGVSVVPLFWLFGSQIWYLSLVQALSGVVWAGYNLAIQTFLFDAVSPPKRARCVAYQATVNGVFVLIGSLLGAYLATHLENPIPFENWFWVPQSNYLMVFMVSGCVRALVTMGLLRIFREVRAVEEVKRRELIFRIAHVRPLAGLIFRPLTLIQGAVRRNREGHAEEE